MRRETIW